MITIKNLCISYDKNIVLENVNLDFSRTGLYCVCGESGSGKSSLLNAISSLIHFSGSIKVDGIEINNLNQDEAANFRLRNIGFIFQDFKLFESQTVEQNVLFPLNVLSNSSERKKKQNCNVLLDFCGMNKTNKRICGRLSGGEKQRVAISRALINNPKIIIADEPTGSLDEKTGEEIVRLLRMASSNTLAIMVTHDLELAYKYADKIIFIKDKTIEKIEINKCKTVYKSIALCKKERKRNTGILPFGFSVNHARQNMKTKKIRTILSTVFMSLGILGVGLSISFSNSIANDIKRAYSSLSETATISVFKPQDENIELEVLKYEDALNVMTPFIEEFNISFGVGYKANFEEMFKDSNECYLTSNSKTSFLSGMTIRNINDYVAITKINEEILPSNISELKEDEIVLGLTINQIRTICMNFGIERTADSLANYLTNNQVNMVLEVSNLDWEYTDEQIFAVKGFTLTNSSYIAHSTPLFNKTIIEDRMRFPTTEDYDKNEYPWVLEKITYITTNNNYEFIKKMRNENILSDYVFQLCDREIFVNKLKDIETNEINCLIPYYAPPSRLNEKEIEYIKSVDKNLKNPIHYNYDSYVNYADSLVSGFGKRTYFCLDENELLETIENNSSIQFANNETEILKEGVIFSDFSQSFKNPVKFWGDNYTLVDGRLPKDLDEIVVSSSLLNSLRKGSNFNDDLYIASTKKEIDEDNGIFTREYKVTKLKIVGIVENEKYYLYHDQYWTEDFFNLRNEQPIKEIMTTSISFSIDDKIDTNVIVNKLKRAFPQFEIINPLTDINKSIDSLCSSISIFIFVISFVSLVISFILLSSCTYLYTQDIKKEIATARCIGVGQKESLKFLYGYVFYSSVISLMVASIELTFSNLAISYFSSSSLSIPFRFSVSPIAYILMILSCLAIGAISSLATSRNLKKISASDCLKI